MAFIVTIVPIVAIVPIVFFIFHFLFKPAVEPIEIGALPEDAVLGLEHPVVLIGEDEQLGLYAFHSGGIEGTHALGGIDAVVFLSMDAEDGGVPVVNEPVRRVGISLTGICRLVLVPISIVILPVAEPVFFSLGVHRLQVECSIVSNEALEPFVVMAGKIIHAETTETGTYCTEPVFVDVGQVGASIVDGGEIVVHALAGPVAADFLAPLTAESRQTVAVGRDDDIAL